MNHPTNLKYGLAMLSLPELRPSHETRARSIVPRARLERNAPRAPALELPSPRTNRILAAIPTTSYRRILPNLEPVIMATGEALCEAGCKPRYVYFPTTSIVSLLCETTDGESTEICAVGNEGVLGFALFMGGETTCSRAVVLSAGHGYRLESSLLKREFSLSGPFMEVLLRYTQALITHMAQTALCNRHHSVDQQLCRRLLLSLDRLPTNELTMTHEQIASMLGVRREGITGAAGKLQAAGLIEYFRGRIKILDRHGLEARACECYGVVKRESKRLMGGGLLDRTRMA
jgi:CRP-like cAMP-binding protein